MTWLDRPKRCHLVLLVLSLIYFAPVWRHPTQLLYGKHSDILWQHDSGMAGNSSDAQFILKHRRYHRPQQSNFISQITLQEHYERLERLGLPIPVKQVPRENGQEKAATPPPVLTNTNVVPMPILGNSKEHHPLSVRRKSNK